MRHNVIKLVRENICKILSDRNHSNTFLGQSPKAKQIKAKINKWDLIRLISLYLAKETINKMERQPTDWEEKKCKQCDQQGISLQNLQIAHVAQYQESKQPNQKMGRKLQ